MPKEEAPLNACAVARRLGVGLSTLNSWLAADENRAPHQRNFHFHSYRGRKRIWSESAYLALECAIALESEPGGMLGLMAASPCYLTKLGHHSGRFGGPP